MLFVAEYSNGGFVRSIICSYPLQLKPGYIRSWIHTLSPLDVHQLVQQHQDANTPSRLFLVFSSQGLLYCLCSQCMILSFCLPFFIKLIFNRTNITPDINYCLMIFLNNLYQVFYIIHPISLFIYVGFQHNNQI